MSLSFLAPRASAGSLGIIVHVIDSSFLAHTGFLSSNVITSILITYMFSIIGILGLYSSNPFWRYFCSVIIVSRSFHSIHLVFMLYWCMFCYHWDRSNICSYWVYWDMLCFHGLFLVYWSMYCIHWVYWSMFCIHWVFMVYWSMFCIH